MEKASRQIPRTDGMQQEVTAPVSVSQLEVLFACSGWTVRVLPNPQATLARRPDLLHGPERTGDSCPESLAVEYEYGSDLVASANWLGACVEAILSLPQVSQFSATLPHLLPDTTDNQRNFTVLDTADTLWRQLAERGRLVEITIITKVQYTATIDLQRKTSSATHRTLTFVARPSSQSNSPTVFCPELESAESALRAGDIAAVCSSGVYSDARAVVDDISALTHQGFITPKRKPRAMPEWQSQEQQEDLREGSPRWGRRMKRAVLGFVGGFEPPGVTALGPGRDTRDFEGGNGRPGWDGKSMVGKVLRGR